MPNGEQMINWIKEILSSSDNASSKRLMGIVAGVAGIVMAWLNVSGAAMVLTFAGGCFGASALQKFAEKIGDKKETPAKPADPAKK